MSPLKERLRDELTTSIKARDALRSSTLRLVLTAISNAEVAGKQARELSDEDVTGILAGESKRRLEAAVAFEDAGRSELSTKERREATIISEFLPPQLTAEEIAELVAATIAELDVEGDGMRAMGRVMGALTPQTRGRADGGLVSAEVRRQLG